MNFTTPADLVAAQAAAAATPPPYGQTDADKALTNSVAAAVDLTKALTDSMSKTLQALGYSPSTAPGNASRHCQTYDLMNDTCADMSFLLPSSDILQRYVTYDIRRRQERSRSLLLASSKFGLATMSKQLWSAG